MGWRKILAVMIAGLRPGAETPEVPPMNSEHVAHIKELLDTR
ncbi:hypothetical protein [Rhodococcus sp. ZPP]|nr:hypothetical protein [Rhodococcus sp. ZPP]